MFPVCNLLTRAESPGPTCLAAEIRLIFLRQTHIALKSNEPYCIKLF